jgi:hypothetical protein
MTPIVNWLTSLGWNLIERPSQKLVQASSVTTVDSNGFLEHSKNFFELPVAQLHKSAAYLLNSYKSHTLISDHSFDQHKINIDIHFDDDMLDLLYAVKSSRMAKRSTSGYTDLRRRLYVPKRPSAASPARSLENEGVAFHGLNFAGAHP